MPVFNRALILEDIDAARLNTSVARVLDLASDSDSEPSEGGNVTLDAAWSGDSESEGDSADSDMDDPLRYIISPYSLVVLDLIIFILT